MIELAVSAGNYIEHDCTVSHKGRTFESGGASLVGDYLTCYLGNNGQATTWHGEVIGTFHITASWATPRSYMSSHMHQVEVNLGNGVVFTGRSAGVGMVFTGKRKVAPHG